MDPMMMAIIAAVVLVLIAGAVFFMKSRSGSVETTSAANRPKTLAEQQREMAQQRLADPIMPSETIVDPLTTAQQYIQRQDFGQAISTLKNAIQTNGQRSALYLPLLNIFAQQKNLAEFNQYLTPLLALNDTDATSQAMSLKRLLDEELAFEAPKVQPVPVSTQALSKSTIITPPESIDFDGFDFDQSPATHSPAKAVVAQPVTPVGDTVSFDDIDFLSEASPTLATVAKPNAAAQQAVVEDLAFDFDELSTPVTPAEVVIDEAEFDFDFEDMTQPVVSATPDVTPQTASRSPIVDNTVSPTNDEIMNGMDGFIFDLEDVTAEPLTAVVANAPYTPTVETTTPVVTTTTPAPLMAQEDKIFDLIDDSRPDTLPVATPTATPPPQVMQDLDTGFSNDFDLDFDLNFDLPTPPAVTPPTKVLVDDEPLFDLALDTPATTPLTAFASPTQSESEPLISEPVTANIATNTISDDYDTFNQLDELYATASPTAAQPTQNVDTIDPAATSLVMLDSDLFSMVDDLDTVQLNLDLASQYVQLGEYDSAKRLVAEITQATPQQQQQLTSLMDKIG